MRRAIGRRRKNRTAFFTTLAPLAWVVATACGGATSGSTEDAGSTRTVDAASNQEDAAFDERGRDANTSMPCSGGAVTFEMRAGEGSTASYCVGRGCTRDWLDLTTDRGDVVAYRLGWCGLSCVDCRSGGCDPICLLPQPLTPKGEQLIWDGRVWVPSSCADGRVCAGPTCAPPGKYVAKMCAASRMFGDAGSCRESMNAPPSCVELEFEYPAAAPVVGVLP